MWVLHHPAIVLFLVYWCVINVLDFSCATTAISFTSVILCASVILSRILPASHSLWYCLPKKLRPICRHTVSESYLSFSWVSMSWWLPVSWLSLTSWPPRGGTWLASHPSSRSFGRPSSYPFSSATACITPDSSSPLKVREWDMVDRHCLNHCLAAWPLRLYFPSLDQLGDLWGICTLLFSINSFI